MTVATTPLPAWREPMVWLVVGGPATVVVASFLTLASVASGPTFSIKDTVTNFDQQRYGVLAQLKARF